MRVLITGGTGRVGTPVTEKFVSNGWVVRVIGAESETSIEGISYTQLDIMDYEGLSQQVAGCDVIVHLAAIAAPSLAPAVDVFRINVAGTYNVYEAAAQAGVKRIVQASSINAIGCFWNTDEMSIEYFPIDEAHPTCTNDGYSFSKEVVEDIASYYWRRDGISSVSFRFPGVWSEALMQDRGTRDNLKKTRQFLDEFLRLPQSEQAAQLADVQKRVIKFRQARMLEFEAREAGLDIENSPGADDLLWSSYHSGRFNFWAFIHTDDSTQAIEKAVIADYEGSHPLFVNSHTNYLDYDSETLIRTFFPNVTKRTHALNANETLVSIDRARALIGFDPQVTMF